VPAATLAEIVGAFVFGAKEIVGSSSGGHETVGALASSPRSRSGLSLSSVTILPKTSLKLLESR
jgi:hypothetical protein